MHAVSFEGGDSDVDVWRSIRRPRGKPAAYSWRCCRDRAGHRPGQPEDGERGKRHGVALPAPVGGVGKARRQLMAPRRGGVPVVVRERESRSHGEGGQPGCKQQTGRAEVDGEHRRSETSSARGGYCVAGCSSTVPGRAWWRAGCGESRTSGSEGGPGKRTGRKADTAPWSDPYLRTLLDAYVAHYNEHQPHRSLGQRAPASADVASIASAEPIQRRATCGGLINEYRTAA